MDHDYKSMKDRPETERPYEKCMRSGPESLSDGELLAVMLRSGTRGRSVMEVAYELLDADPIHKGLAGLYLLDDGRLRQINGIGRVKSVQIRCLLELSKRLARAGMEEQKSFSGPETVAAYFMEEMRHLQKERVLLLLLDVRLKRMDQVVLSDGSVDSAYVDVREVFSLALKKGASSVILIHNHPSGDPEPSEEDILLTKRVCQAGKLLGIALLDHIVIGDRCYVSFKEENILSDLM